MRRFLKLCFGLLSYLVFILTIAYSVAFFGNLLVARTIDSAAILPFGEALIVNGILLMGFALQHSGMAREPFKKWLCTHVSPCLERSTYVLASSLATITIIALWQPMGGIVWSVENTLLSMLIYVSYFSGWGLMIYATFLINHFELFGLRQAWAAWQGVDCHTSELRTPGLYRLVRHPIYLGWLMIMWSSPVMTVTHLVFAAGMTFYMLVGIQLEERDLAVELPEYPQYKRKVPMLIPSYRKRLRSGS